MSQVRTISGIPDDLWQDAKDEYDTISGGIKDLLEEDLRTDDGENGEAADLLKNSELTNKQIKLAEDLMKNGQIEKTPAQLGNKLANHFADKDYKEKARKNVLESDVVPVEKSGKGTKGGKIECPKCQIGFNLAALRNAGFECPKCEVRLYDI